MQQQGLPFAFDAPISFFEKAGVDEARRRRIGGLVSTETRDRQDEIVLQRGLDFSEFIRHGWLNNNHSKETTGIVGYPEEVKLFEKGAELPNGSLAPATGHWIEGYLLTGHKPADEIWELGQALQKSGRRLGFSIEGNVERRTGPDRKIIAKARVKNVAVTNAPVNTDTRLEVIAKSLRVIEEAEHDDLEKAYEAFHRALGMGVATPGIRPVGPRSGICTGRVITEESLEGPLKDTAGPSKRKRKRKKKLSKSEAVVWFQERLPFASAAELGRVVDATLEWKGRGLL